MGTREEQPEPQSHRIIKRPRAYQDLDEQAAYLQRESPRVALRFLEAADAAFASLADMPTMGREYDPDNPRLAGVRTFRISGFPHLVFYRPLEDGIEVLRVLHGARDVPHILQEEDE
jgi:toxin ParE1/3/4